LSGVHFPAPEPTASREEEIIHFLSRCAPRLRSLFWCPGTRDYRFQSLKATRSRL